MDVAMLSRSQFAAAAFFYFLFVPLTLGIFILVAFIETPYVHTGDERTKRMARFWGKLLIINSAVDVVAGLTLESQFGTNWSRWSRYVGGLHNGRAERSRDSGVRALRRGRHASRSAAMEAESRLEHDGRRRRFQRRDAQNQADARLRRRSPRAVRSVFDPPRLSESRPVQKSGSRKGLLTAREIRFGASLDVILNPPFA